MIAKPLTQLAIVTALLAAPVLAQQPSGVPGLVRIAAKHVDNNQLDEAISVLWRAERELHTLEDGEAHDVLQSAVADMLREVDSLDDTRRAADKKVATQLVKLARKYKTRKWYAMAQDLLERANCFNPGCAEKDLAAVREKAGYRPEGSEPSVNASLPGEDDILQTFHVMERTGDWTRDDGGMRSPMLRKDVAALVLSKSPSHQDGRVNVEIRLEAEQGKGALAFGVVDKANFYLAELLLTDDQRCVLSVYRVQERINVNRLSEDFFELDKDARRGGIKVSVEIQGHEVTGSINEQAGTKSTCPSLPYGGTGLYISGNSTSQAPVVFRKLTICEPSKAATGEPSQLDLLTAKLGTAESLLLDKRKDEAVLSLYEVCRELTTLDVAGHRELADRALALIDKHDFNRKHTTKAHKEIANAYVELGRLYMAGDRPLAALTVLESASMYDDATPAEALAEALAEARDKLGSRTASLDIEGALPAEASADGAPLDTLKNTFDGGRQYWAMGWKWRDDYLEAPPHGDRALYMAVDPYELQGKMRVQVNLNGEGGAGLAFARTKTDFYMLGLDENSNGRLVSIARWHASRWETLQEYSIDGEGWVELSIEFTPAQFIFRAGAGDPVEIPRANFGLRGSYSPALYVWKPGARFRGYATEK